MSPAADQTACATVQLLIELKIIIIWIKVCVTDTIIILSICDAQDDMTKFDYQQACCYRH